MPVSRLTVQVRVSWWLKLYMLSTSFIAKHARITPSQRTLEWVMSRGITCRVNEK